MQKRLNYTWGKKWATTLSELFSDNVWWTKSSEHEFDNVLCMNAVFFKFNEKLEPTLGIRQTRSEYLMEISKRR